jgi:WD40 repeat protein
MKITFARLVIVAVSIAIAQPLIAQDLPAKKASPAKADKPVTLAWFAAFSPDAKWLVTPHGSWKGDEAGEVRVWNVATGEVKHVIKSPRGVRAAAWSPKGTFFASGNYAGHLRLYDPETAEVKLELKTRGGSIETLQISPDEKTIYGSSGNGEVNVWDIPGKKHASSFKAHTGGIWGMRLSRDGKMLATAGQDTFVNVWLVSTDKPVAMWKKKHPSETNGVAFTSSGTLLATGCADGKIRLFDWMPMSATVDSGKEMAVLEGHSGSVTDLCFTSNDERLVSSGGDRTVRVWDVKERKQLSLWDGHTNLVFGATYSYDDKLVASGAWDGTVRIWEASSGKTLHTLTRE